MRTEFGMRCPEFDWHPARRRLRHFAWLTALFLAVLSWAGGTPTWSLSLRLAAALLFAIGTVLPGVLRWPYMALLLIVYLFARLGNWIGRAFSPTMASWQGRGRRPEQLHSHHGATGTHG